MEYPSYRSFLIHHGVKGQEWGVRNGPPYPLNSGSAKKLHQKALEEGRERMNARQPVYEEWNTKVSKKTLDVGPVEKLSDLRRLKGNEDIQKVRYAINHPGDEPSDEKQAGRSYNCPNCAVAFDMTERGYDVHARPKQNQSNVEDIEKAYVNGSLEHKGNVAFNADGKATEFYKRIDELRNKRFADKELNSVVTDYWNYLDKQTNAIEKKIISEKIADGPSRGVIVIGWMNEDVHVTDPNNRTKSFHAFSYKVEDNKMYIIDTQSRRSRNLKGWDASKDHFLEGADPREVYLMRTDTLKPSDDIGRYVYSRRR